MSPTLDTNAEIVGAYGELLQKAVFIVNGWPRIADSPKSGKSGYPMELDIHDGQATVTWVDEDSYEGYNFTREHSFPAEMLSWTSDQLAAWKAEEEERMRLKYEQQTRDYALKREAEERAKLAELRAKYG